MLIHELLACHAAENPAKTAVSDVLGNYSYGELEARSAVAARALSTLGARAGDTAAVYVPYVKEIVLGAFSAWRAGCVYLPFDDAYPEERLNYMLENSGAVAIMTVREFWRQKPLEFPERKVIYLDDLTAAVVATDPEPSLTEDAPAMLLYTSGTTGRPKGVLHTHGLLANLLEWMDPREAPEVNENSRGGIATGFTFVGSQVFMFGTLAKGGTVCIAPEAARRELDCLNRFIHENRVTHFSAVRPGGHAGGGL